MSGHPIVHVEFVTDDHEAIGQFYHKLFGWQIQQMPEMNYATFDPGDGPGGGFAPVSEECPPGRVMVSVASADVDGDLRRVEQFGGKVLEWCTEIPGIGYYGVFQDPSGNQVSLFKPLENMS